MAEKDGLTELASMFKARDVKTPSSMTTGIVVSPPPNPKIRLNDVITLEKHQLIFASSVVNDYERRIKFTDENCGITTTENDGGDNASSHNHGVELLEVDTLMKWTDTLIEGDEVILMPVMDGQLYYVLDKAVRFE